MTSYAALMAQTEATRGVAPGIGGDDDFWIVAFMFMLAVGGTFGLWGKGTLHSDIRTWLRVVFTVGLWALVVILAVVLRS
jgi:hypothetical protein